MFQNRYDEQVYIKSSKLEPISLRNWTFKYIMTPQLWKQTHYIVINVAVYDFIFSFCVAWTNKHMQNILQHSLWFQSVGLSDICLIFQSDHECMWMFFSFNYCSNHFVCPSLVTKFMRKSEWGNKEKLPASRYHNKMELQLSCKTINFISRLHWLIWANWKRSVYAVNQTYLILTLHDKYLERERDLVQHNSCWLRCSI